MPLCDKYPFLTQYFENEINNSKGAMAHSILFYGTDISAQYELALYIARLLNCKKDHNEDCNCLDCNWIRSHEHPAVLTISKTDNKPDDDNSTTVISIKQAQMIKNLLTTTSDSYRVFIFCDKNKDDEPMGLNNLNFQEETANALLKTIEEPPSKTVFFFLTRDKNDLLETIISRSQCFFVPNMNVADYDYSNISDVFENYFEFERKNVFNLAKDLNNLSDDKIKTLESMQNYMLSLMKANLNDKLLKMRLIKDIKSVETAKKQIQSSVAPLNVFENLCLNIIQ